MVTTEFSLEDIIKYRASKIFFFGAFFDNLNIFAEILERNETGVYQTAFIYYHSRLYRNIREVDHSE